MPLWAFLIAFLDFFLCLVQYGPDSMGLNWAAGRRICLAAGLLLIYVLTQVTRQLVQPKLVGDSMGLNPLLTLLLYIWDLSK